MPEGIGTCRVITELHCGDELMWEGDNSTYMPAVLMCWCVTFCLFYTGLHDNFFSLGFLELVYVPVEHAERPHSLHTHSYYTVLTLFRSFIVRRATSHELCEGKERYSWLNENKSARASLLAAYVSTAVYITVVPWTFLFVCAGRQVGPAFFSDRHRHTS